jgi:ABC-type Fe3+ transport system substrate-binding protein
VAKAKQEGALSANIRPGLGPIIPELTAAFNKRFGLNLQINLDALTTEDELFSKINASMKAGAPPPLDALEGPDYNNLNFIQAGYAAKVDNWEGLLAEINPDIKSGAVKPEQVSPRVFGGYSFIWSNVTKALIYNTKLVSKQDVPRTRPELGDAKWKGKLAMVPWPEDFQYGVMFYPRDEWLKTVDKIGQNSAGVYYYADSLQRITLGQIAMAPTNAYYYFQAKDKDPQSPVDLQWFQDYTPVASVPTLILKGAAHPAAGTLFAMFMTTVEAENIFQKAVPYPNLAFGHTAIDERERKAVNDSGTKVVSYFESDKNLETLLWYSTKEGQEYSVQIIKGQTQRK